LLVAGSLHQMLGTRPEIIYERHHRLLGANLALQPEKRTNSAAPGTNRTDPAPAHKTEAT